MQGAGDVRRGQHDGVGLAFAAGLEAAGRLPMGVPLGFEGLGFEALFHGTQWVAPDFRSGWRGLGGPQILPNQGFACLPLGLVAGSFLAKGRRTWGLSGRDRVWR